MTTDAPSDAAGERPIGVRVAIALLAAVLFTPFVILPDLYFPFVTGRAIVFRCLALALLAVLTLMLFTRRHRVGDARDPVLLAIVAFLAVGGVSALLGSAPLRSLFGDLQRGWGLFAWFALGVYYLALRTFADDRTWDRLLDLAVGIATVFALYGIAQQYQDVLGIPVLTARRNRIDATTGNPGLAAGFLVLGVGLAAYRRAAATRVHRQLLLSAAFVVQAFALSLTETRAAAVGVGLAVVAAGSWLLVRRGGSRAVRIALVAIIAAIVAIAGMVLLVPEHEIVRSVPLLRRLASAVTGSVGGRFHNWSTALDAFLARPLLGYGPENYQIAFSRHYPAEFYTVHPGRVYADRAHNAFLDILATTGIAGFAAYLGIWGGYFHRLAGALGAGRFSPAQAALLGGAVLAYMIYLAFWFEDHSSAVLLVTILAFVSHRAAGEPVIRFGDRERPETRRIVVLACALLLFAAIGYRHGIRVGIAAAALQDAVTASEDRGVEDRLAAFRRAADTSAPEATEGLVRYVEYLREFAPEIDEIRADPYRFGVLRGATEHALGAFERALRVDPENSRMHLQQSALARLALLLSRDAGFYEMALESQRRAIEYAPTRTRYRHLLADLYVLGGDRERAVAQIDSAVAIYDAFGESHRFGASVRLAFDDVSGAADWLERAIELGDTGDPDLVVEVATALERSGEVERAVRLYDLYLNERTAGFPVHDRSENRYRRLNPNDREIAGRLALVELRAGRERRAAIIAARLQAELESPDPELSRFLTDLRHGRADRWMDRAELIRDD